MKGGIAPRSFGGRHSGSAQDAEALLTCLNEIHRIPDFANFDDCALIGDDNSANRVIFLTTGRPSLASGFRSAVSIKTVKITAIH